MQIKVWHIHFKDGWETVEWACNKQNTWGCWMCTGCNQQRLTTDSVRTRNWFGIPKTTVSKILMQDLGMKHVVTKFILWLLLPEQMEHHAAVADDLIQTTTSEPDLVPCNFWFFPRLKSPLNGKRFQTVDEIQENRTAESNSTKIFGRVIWAVQGMLQELCVQLYQGTCFEGSEVSLSYVQCFLCLQ